MCRMAAEAKGSEKAREYKTHARELERIDVVSPLPPSLSFARLLLSEGVLRPFGVASRFIGP